MDILKISDNSLKVMLSAEDMNSYCLDNEVLENNKAYSVDILKEIIRYAGSKCGFITDTSKLFVQLYSSSKGDCEIFASRIDSSGVSMPDYKSSVKEYTFNHAVQNRGVYIYSFDGIIPITHVCNRLRTANYSGSSFAYKELFGKTYYLVLEESSPFPGEYGGHLCNRNTSYYINEHCTLICNNAVCILGNLA